MKNLYILLVFPLLVALFTSCEKDDEEIQPANDPLLHVEFTNDSNSEFVISRLEIISHGNAGEADQGPIGNWSGNILPVTRLNPGISTSMDLAIPNLYKYVYRLAVIDENGTEIYLHEQEGYNDDGGPTITHWGSHKRKVYCSVQRNINTGLIYIQAWGDNAY